MTLLVIESKNQKNFSFHAHDHRSVANTRRKDENARARQVTHDQQSATFYSLIANVVGLSLQHTIFLFSSFTHMPRYLFSHAAILVSFSSSFLVVIGSHVRIYVARLQPLAVQLRKYTRAINTEEKWDTVAKGWLDEPGGIIKEIYK